MRLFSYKLINDSGFAPNPFFGVLTLATCKPQIRKLKKIGDWIAGFTSKKLCGDEVGKERLIYLMRVTDKIPMICYFFHPDFQKKIPDLKRQEAVYKAGDNIYKPTENGIVQLKNKNHGESEKEEDLSGEYVLISTEFYYFGRKALEIPDDLRPEIPPKCHPHGYRTNADRAKKFIEYVKEKVNDKVGVHHPPHTWPDNDMSWRQGNETYSEQKRI